MPNHQTDYFLKLVKARKTTYEFSSKKVKDSDIKKILEAARWAPSCENIQPWKFIVIKDKKRISQLMKTAYYGVFHSDPPLLIALVLLKECWAKEEHRCIKYTKLGKIEAYLCISMPALSMVLEAQELGIDSSLLSPERKTVFEILKARQDDDIPLMIALGYEKKGAFQKPRERIGLKELTYGEYFGGEIKL